jgi:hypothetical protein
VLFGREQSPRNDDPEHEPRAGFLKRGFRWFVVVLVVALAGGLAVWVVTGPAPNKPKLIASDNLPDRRAPEDQSSLVPNQDQPIYEQVSPGHETDRGQELLKEPEKPMDQTAVKAQAEAQDRLRAQNPNSEQVAEAGKPEAVPTTKPTGTAPPPSPPLSIPKIPLDTTPPSPPTQDVKIQVASVRTPEQAEAEWKRVSGRHPDLLSRLIPSYDRFDSQSGATYYRVQGGPLPDKELANLLCAQLEARKVDCIVVSP